MFLIYLLHLQLPFFFWKALGVFESYRFILNGERHNMFFHFCTAENFTNKKRENKAASPKRSLFLYIFVNISL